MEKINEIKIPAGVEIISVTQHEDKVVIELIPQRKFKAGDKVRIKDGISSKTHKGVGPSFMDTMDKFIGKELTVKEYNKKGWVISYDSHGYCFHEDWLEPWSEELKKGDLAIFWDSNKENATIRLYDRKEQGVYYDSISLSWTNAIKFESKEQYEKILKGNDKRIMKEIATLRNFENE